MSKYGAQIARYMVLILVSKWISMTRKHSEVEDQPANSESHFISRWQHATICDCFSEHVIFFFCSETPLISKNRPIILFFLLFTQGDKQKRTKWRLHMKKKPSRDYLSGLNHLSEWCVHRYEKSSVLKQANCNTSIPLCLLEKFHCSGWRFDFT